MQAHMNDVERLFSSIVLVGLATGCGGSATTQAGDEGSGGAGELGSGGTGALGTGGASLTPDTCESPAQFRCDEGSCFCDPNAPVHSTDCEYPSTFFCEDWFCEEDICVIDDVPATKNLSCSCDETRPKGPQDCDDPTEFTCLAAELWECACEPSAPRTPEDCEDPVRFTCQGLDPLTGCSCTGLSNSELEQCSGIARCQSEEPRFGCECIILVIR
jgi:hypothetical protein